MPEAKPVSRKSQAALCLQEDEDVPRGPKVEKEKVDYVKKFITPLKGLIPLQVYIPKGVDIGNQRVAGVYLFFDIVILIAWVTYFFWNQKYYTVVKPEMQVTPCRTGCVIDPPTLDTLTDKALTSAYCNSPSYTIGADVYNSIQCAGRCGKYSSAASSCLSNQEVVQTTGEEEFFVPTFFRERWYVPNTSGSCPVGYISSAFTVGWCQKFTNNFLAGAENLLVTFNHDFSVIPKWNTLSNPHASFTALKAHTGAYMTQGWEAGMKTFLLGSTGQVLKTFEQGDSIALTVQELLSAAYYDGLDSGALSGLDSKYPQDESGVKAGTPLRLTGLSVIVDIWTSNIGLCKIFPTLSKNGATKVKIDFDGPLACLTVQAKRVVTSQKENIPVGNDGTFRLREMNGVSIRFRKMGEFTFYDEQGVISSLTMLWVWAQIPLAVTAWFVLNLLGRLSSIYRCLMTQELSVGDAVKGFCTRALVYSSAFMDLSIPTSEGTGINKLCIAERLSNSLSSSSKVDDATLSNVSESIYSGLKSYKKDNAPEAETVTCQEFVAACCANEPLVLKTIVQIFDKDRKLGFLESVFLDKALAQVRRQAEQDAAEEGEEEGEVEDKATKPDDSAQHSAIVQACSNVQSMLEALEHIETTARKTATDVDVNPNTLGLHNKSSDGQIQGGPSEGQTVLPKLNRSVSQDSIGDEGDATKRDFRDAER